MKTKKITIIGIIILSMTLIPNFILAQWVLNPPNRVFTLNYVGVGTTNPLSALHVNGNLTTNLTGEAFRTTGPTTQTNAWRMFTGAGNGAERFSITIPANSSDAVLQTQQPNSRMMFNTNGAINRLLIMDGGTAASGGRVAMGNNLPTNFIPQARLQLLQFGAGAPTANMFRTDGDQNFINRWQLFTGDSAGATTEKFRLEVLANSTDVELNAVQSSARMWLNTRNVNRILIDSGDITGGRVAIGNNLPLNFVPQARLHVYQNFAGAPAVMFLTNGSSAVENSWKLTTSPTPGVLNEIFKLYTNPLGGFGNDIFLQAGRPNGRMIFNTTGTDTSTTRMIITDGVLAGNTGLIGMGNNFLTPRSQLHLNDGIFPTYLQITNTATNVNPLLPTANDGFKLGIDSNGTAHVKQQENLPLIFYTNNTENARILPAAATTMGTNVGMVGIGNWTTAPNITNPINAKLDIDGDLRIRTVTQRDTLLQVLVIDSADKNRVHWRSVASFGGTVTANNGVSVNATTSAVQLGVPCQDSLGNNNLPEILANQFTEDRVVAIGDFNLWFATYAGDKGGVGIGGQPASTPFCGTGNTLEISANGASKYGAASSSGLRFNHLTSDSLTVPVGINGVDNTKVLTVDNDGDVVLVDVAGGVGNYCSDPQNPLTSDYEIPLGNQNYYFTGQGAFARVGIGVPCNIPLLLSKFSVLQQSSYSPPPSFPSISIAGQFLNVASGFSTYGILAEVQSNATVKAAGTFDANGSGTYHVGVYGRASGAIINRAGYFAGDLETTSSAVITGSDQMFKTNVEAISSATEILKQLKPRTYNMDVTNFPQFNFQDRLQYGFIAQEVEGVLPMLVHESYMPSEIDSLGNEIHAAVNYKSLNYNALIPITVQAVNELNAQINGIKDSAIVRDSIIDRSDSLIRIMENSTLSDQNVKTNVQNLANSLDKVKQMRGVSYEWSSAAQNNMNLDNKEHIGFIAQEITAIEPLLTFTDDSSLVHVNYDRVAPLLVESVKELDTKNHTQDSIIQALDSINNDLETRLAYLENCIRNANICTEGNRTMNTEPDNNINNRSVELTNVNSIILDQNLPNPFKENTVINYNIPTEVTEAKLLFYDLNGRIIKELIIEERGESKLTVYGVNLKTGIYTYSLIADGELIATKKMVKK